MPKRGECSKNLRLSECECESLCPVLVLNPHFSFAENGDDED